MKFDIEVKIRNIPYRIFQREENEPISVENITPEKESDWIVITTTNIGKLYVQGKGWTGFNP